MRLVNSSRTVKIPEGVSVAVKSRKVRVKGPRGILTRDFSHLKVDMKIKGDTLTAQVFWGNRAQLSCLRTVTSHIDNMIKGVTVGYKYKMRLVYAHFPINVKIEDQGKKIELRNFLGQKLVRSVDMFDGVTVATSDVKDELIVTGNDIDLVSQSAANIQQITRCCDKDIRKFLDGAYISAKTAIVEEE